MKTVKRFFVFALSFASILSLSACSSKKSDNLQIFSDSNHEEYQSAASEHFSKVCWTSAAFLDNPQEYNKSFEGGTMNLSVGTISDDTRYVVVVLENEEIFDHEPIGGKRYSVFVCDNGEEDIKVSMHYSVGTTDNCVVKGNIVDGEAAVNKTIDISASGVADPAERASMIFNVLYEALVEIEGK